MNPPHTLTAQGEEIWLNLRYHIEWARGFALIMLFASDYALLTLLRERLTAIYRTRVSYLQLVSPPSATTLVEDIMALIRTPSELYEHAGAPLWLDLAVQRGEHWNQARDVLLARLNEHRELLRKRLRRPLILALPAGYAQRLRELAPDLWSIRDFSLNLEEMRLTDQEGVLALDTSPADVYERTPVPPLSSVSASFAKAQWQEWQRLKQRGAKSQEVLQAGWWATDAALFARDLNQAEQIAAEVLAIARELTADIGDAPETIRGLSISLEQVSTVAEAQGRHDEAAVLLQEALMLWRRLNLAFPNTVEYQTSIERLEHYLAFVREE